MAAVEYLLPVADRSDGLVSFSKIDVRLKHSPSFSLEFIQVSARQE